MNDKSSHSLSPYVHLIESRLIPHRIQYGIFHQLSGDIFHVDEKLRLLLAESKLKHHCITSEELEQVGLAGSLISELIAKQYLVTAGYDALTSFSDYFVTRPRQNPAVAFKTPAGSWRLVRLSMAEKIYSPRPNTLPPVIEEDLSLVESEIFLAANGTKKLGEILAGLRSSDREKFDVNQIARAIDKLTSPERQLIKFAADSAQVANPFMPCNIVPRNFYHASRWSEDESIKDFHREGIDDAAWEFDLLEPTVNHALRFHTDLLGGFDYGSRFCQAVLTHCTIETRPGGFMKVLEVGGGLGTFARSFIAEAQRAFGLQYHILELSGTLKTAQQTNLASVSPPVEHFDQDATEFDLGDRKFDLIIANEVVADFPVAEVQQAEPNSGERLNFVGAGASFIEKHGLEVAGSPAQFAVNAGLFQFIERAWQHLPPGGVLIFSEYGSLSLYPAQSFHLNHSEFSIHFGHALQCGRKLGFECQVFSLAEFLRLDPGVAVLNGREEHIRCLDYVLQQHGQSLPFALISQRAFEKQFGALAEEIQLTGFSFSPLSDNFYYGPNIADFIVVLMKKPVDI